MKQWFKESLREFPTVFSVLRTVYRFLFPSSEKLMAKQIMKTLGEKPSVFFVQVGAGDGVQGDLIHSLIDNNEHWSGVFIEPVEFVYRRLKQNYKDSERFVFENIAIGIEKGIKQFYYVSEEAKAKLGDDLPYWYDQLGSFDRNHILKHLDGKLEPYIVEEEIDCVPLQEILDKNNVKKIDLLHIDTEGFDYRVLSQINFNKYKPSIVLYEHRHLRDDEREKANSLLKNSGYSLRIYAGDTLAILKG